jgi:mono/diheme cytochrome c family protein
MDCKAWAGAVLAATSALVLSSTAFAADAALERGAYLARIMDCGGCHTTGALRGQPDPALYLAGADVGFEVPGLGIFYPPNLTGDVETGLGGWSAAEIVAAVRTGVRPDGRTLAPIMPYHAYGMLTDDDAGALAAYLKSLAPIRNKAPDPAGPGAAAPAPYLTLKVPGTG